jgi:hypothetical protein
MSARRDPYWVIALCRFYSAALRLYPRAHQRAWGQEMRLAFRDRCREAVRAGRGPWRVLLADFIPDFATSAVREHADFVFGDSSMKRTRLLVLLFAFAGLLIFRVQLGDCTLAVHDWWKQYQQAQDDRALREHEAALAVMVEQRGGAHADVIAAEFYWSAGRGFHLLYFTSDHPEPPIADERTWLDHADTAFARALRANDVWAWWLATGACPARAAICHADIALERLRQLDGDNGAVWMLDLDLANEAHDPVRQRAALAKLAASGRYDSHFGDAMRSMLATFALKPLPGRLRVTNPYDATAATSEQSTVLLAGELATEIDAMRGLGYKPLLDACRTRDPAVDAERAADCRAAGRLLAERKGTILEDRFGDLLLLRAASPAELRQARQAIRDSLWRDKQYFRFDPETSPENAQHWRAAWMAGGSEAQVEDRLLRERGIALQAPANFFVEARMTDSAR